MKITVTMPSTGIVYAPGLARPVIIDSDRLAPAVAKRLARLADEGQLFAGADITPSVAPKLRDAQETVIAVEAGGKVRTIHVTDAVGSISNKALREFVTLVREQADRLRRHDKPD